jgi:hypothetical protein
VGSQEIVSISRQFTYFATLSYIHSIETRAVSKLSL